ncbi:uncharacterized protein I303_105228 [Kwoniella dejecticola CBS 10117]|uniref:Uncharacterized protein n=1 Tax=Kwoniella dejecticola CBS 10117 TaxID=1296121 RepID=A0A1A6A332_9TREE|nr:uncharacterized protein I303_05325 [Kwoniella dejecticola CBS 10117]OBR84467.1 hypothetical protein I303_05325 [Kwoniella dejecticola CBS 10117]
MANLGHRRHGSSGSRVDLLEEPPIPKITPYPPQDNSTNPQLNSQGIIPFPTPLMPHHGHQVGIAQPPSRPQHSTDTGRYYPPSSYQQPVGNRNFDNLSASHTPPNASSSPQSTAPLRVSAVSLGPAPRSASSNASVTTASLIAAPRVAQRSPPAPAQSSSHTINTPPSRLPQNSTASSASGSNQQARTQAPLGRVGHYTGNSFANQRVCSSRVNPQPIITSARNHPTESIPESETLQTPVPTRSPPPAYSQPGSVSINPNAPRFQGMSIAQITAAPTPIEYNGQSFCVGYYLTCSQCEYVYKAEGDSFDSVGECPQHGYTRAIPHGATTFESASPPEDSNYKWACGSYGRIKNTLENSGFWYVKCKSQKCNNTRQPLIRNPTHKWTFDEPKKYCCKGCRHATGGPKVIDRPDLGPRQKGLQYVNRCTLHGNDMPIIPVEFARDQVYFCSHCYASAESSQVSELCKLCIATNKQKYAEIKNARIVKSTLI